MESSLGMPPQLSNTSIRGKHFLFLSHIWHICIVFCLVLLPSLYMYCILHGMASPPPPLGCFKSCCLLHMLIPSRPDTTVYDQPVLFFGETFLNNWAHKTGCQTSPVSSKDGWIKRSPPLLGMKYKEKGRSCHFSTQMVGTGARSLIECLSPCLEHGEKNRFYSCWFHLR